MIFKKRHIIGHKRTLSESGVILIENVLSHLDIDNVLSHLDIDIHKCAECLHIDIDVNIVIVKLSRLLILSFRRHRHR